MSLNENMPNTMKTQKKSENFNPKKNEYEQGSSGPRTLTHEAEKHEKSLEIVVQDEGLASRHDMNITPMKLSFSEISHERKHLEEPRKGQESAKQLGDTQFNPISIGSSMLSPPEGSNREATEPSDVRVEESQQVQAAGGKGLDLSTAGTNTNPAPELVNKDEQAHPKDLVEGGQETEATSPLQTRGNRKSNSLKMRRPSTPNEDMDEEQSDNELQKTPRGKKRKKKYCHISDDDMRETRTEAEEELKRVELDVGNSPTFRMSTAGEQSREYWKKVSMEPFLDGHKEVDPLRINRRINWNQPFYKERTSSLSVRLDEEDKKEVKTIVKDVVRGMQLATKQDIQTVNTQLEQIMSTLRRIEGMENTQADKTGIRVKMASKRNKLISDPRTATSEKVTITTKYPRDMEIPDSQPEEGIPEDMEGVEAEENKSKEKGKQPEVPRDPIPTPKADIQTREEKRMQETQKKKVDEWLKKFPWFTRNQMSRILAAAINEKDVALRLSKDFYTELEITEDEDPAFKMTHGRGGKTVQDTVIDCLARLHADSKCKENGVQLSNREGQKTHAKFYHEQRRREIQQERIRNGLEQHAPTEVYGKSGFTFPTVIPEDKDKEVRVEWVMNKIKTETHNKHIPTGPKTWAQTIAQQTKYLEKQSVPKAPNNTPTATGWQKVEKKKVPQNLPGNLRRVVMQRSSNRNLSMAERSNILTAANVALRTSRNSCRFQTIQVNAKGTITIMTREKEAAEEALKNSSDIIREVGRVCPDVIRIQPDETWNRLKIHDVSVTQGIYFRPQNIRQGILRIKQDLEEQNSNLELKMDPRWLLSPRAIQEAMERMGRRASTIVICIKSNEKADELVARGVRLGGSRLRVERYINAGPDTLCELCSRWGHMEYNCMPGTQAKCSICAGPHRSQKHKCEQRECAAPAGIACKFTVTRCSNCQGPHKATSNSCAKAREARAEGKAQGNTRGQRNLDRTEGREDGTVREDEREGTQESTTAEPQVASGSGGTQTKKEKKVPAFARGRAVHEHMRQWKLDNNWDKENIYQAKEEECRFRKQLLDMEGDYPMEDPFLADFVRTGEEILFGDHDTEGLDKEEEL
ncbi:hypothetical protein EDC01DRAFT_758423 [Geopyxis carbonaria]|nr:hypothetical protein EDC01DRAFT_758423 [Geopyxis carbonaria]